MSVLLPLVHARMPIIVLVAMGLHLVWAVGLAIDPASYNATALHSLLLLTAGPLTASSLLTLVACSAGLGCMWRWGDVRRIPSRLWRAFLILPQQCILIMSSIGAINAMLASTFADGVVRPRWFIIVDQIPVILITLGHCTALAHIARARSDDG